MWGVLGGVTVDLLSVWCRIVPCCCEGGGYQTCEKRGERLSQHLPLPSELGVSHGAGALGWMKSSHRSN